MEKFKLVLFPGKVIHSPNRPLSQVLAPWIDEEGNLVLAPDAKVAPTVNKTSKLVFKRTKNEGIKFIGCAVSETTFTQMADFVYSPPDVSQHISGPAISKQSVPQMYNYEGNPNAPALDSKRDSAGAVAFLRFKDECEAPSNPTPVALSQMATDQDSELLAKVKALFAARPVWQRNSLEEALSLGSIPAWRLAEVLRQVSYLFLDGPWRKCYVRFGFDPRKESSARVLQMIDFRDPFFKTEQGARSQTSGPGDRSLDIHFRSAPSNRSQLYQLCDIEDPAIQAVVNAQGSKSEPDPHTGWLTETEIDSIRNQMKIKSESMRRAALHSFQGDRK